MTADAREVKQSLRLDFDDDDGRIEEKVLQARAAAEDYVGAEYPIEETPPLMRAAIQLMAAYMYEHPSDAGGKEYEAMRKAFENLLYTMREIDVMI